MSLGEIKKLIVKVNCRLAIKILFTCYVIFIWAAAADFFFAHCVTLNEYFRQIAQIKLLEYLGNYPAVRVIQLEFINAAFLTCNIFFFCQLPIGFGYVWGNFWSRFRKICNFSQFNFIFYTFNTCVAALGKLRATDDAKRADSIVIFFYFLTFNMP